MEENKIPPQAPQQPQHIAPPADLPPLPAPGRTILPMEKPELILGVLTAVFSYLLCNSLLFCGPNLGFAVGGIGILLTTVWYLGSNGFRLRRYPLILIILCAGILAAFPRSADTALKSWMILLLLAVPSLGFCLAAGKNLFDPAGICSLADAPRTLILLGVGKIPESCKGAKNAARTTGSAAKSLISAGLGLLIALPLLCIVVPLLMQADAAFEGMLDRLPDFKILELLTTAPLAVSLTLVYYTRASALRRIPKSEPRKKVLKGLSTITVNTVLVSVAIVYIVYLFSQLAYFSGGFSGLLPEEFTMAEYARRGFFEMSWLCAINLAIIGLAMGLARPREGRSLLTRILCLFLGAVTLFLVCTASAKMLMYIQSYGLTRMRVLTEVFMIWLGGTIVFVCIRLFAPRMPYMKYAVVLGLILCAGLMWADVDAQIAKYNVEAYQSGKLDTVDVEHLSQLNDGAVPYLYELTRDSNSEIALAAGNALRCRAEESRDIRSWNSSTARAKEYLRRFRAEDMSRVLGIDISPESIEVLINTYTSYRTWGEYAVAAQLPEDQAAALEKKIAVGEIFNRKGLPLALKALLYPHTDSTAEDFRGPYFREDGAYIAEKIKDPCWFFRNRTPEIPDHTDYASLHSENDAAFTIALYDANTNTLYFFMNDR